MDSIKNISQEKWDLLANSKIYFGHQSVGFNMVDGIEMILKENQNIQLDIKKGNHLKMFTSPVFAHDRNGSNRKPKSKIDAFYDLIEGGLGNHIDIAGFKFCYVDIEQGVDVQDVFNYYKLKMNDLIIKYPKVKFVHFTVPIKSLQSGPKGFIKKILGKDIGLIDNKARQEYNDLLLNEFNNQPIFDLAKVESSYPNGKREFTLVNDDKIYSMIHTYTNDGGHLSKKGKKEIGIKFLEFLANLTSGRIN